MCCVNRIVSRVTLELRGRPQREDHPPTPPILAAERNRKTKGKNNPPPHTERVAGISETNALLIKKKKLIEIFTYILKLAP